MARPLRGNFQAWLRGGQTMGHTFDMVFEVVGRIALISAILAAIALCALFLVTTPRQQTGGFATMEAALCQAVGKPFPQRLSYKDQQGEEWSVAASDLASFPAARTDSRPFWMWASGLAILWFWGTCALIWLFGKKFVHEGEEKLKPRFIRGQTQSTIESLVKQIETFNVTEAAKWNVTGFVPPKLAGIPYPYGTEMEHTLVVGSPGAGKSQAIHHLIDTVRAKKQRGIVFDPELDYIRAHYNPATDIILNPFDARSPGWSPFYDAVDYPDWVKLGYSIFKDPKSGDPYWISVARSIFSWTGFLLVENDKDVKLTDLLETLFGSPKDLQKLLGTTPAGMHLHGIEGPRVASLLSVVVEGAEPLIYLYREGKRFSITEWVNNEKEDGGFLFLSAPESHMDALRPLLGFWSELTVGAILSRHGQKRVPTWFFLDEFHSAGRIDKLADGPQRLRKYGGAVVLGFQQVSQLTDLYGPDKAKTIIGQCQTKLILRAGDFETAEHMSDQLGRQVVRRVEENTSYGANSIRDGVGLQPREELEPVMLPEDVLNLPKFSGVIRVSNARKSEAFPIARMVVPFKAREEKQPGYVKADGDPIKKYLKFVREKIERIEKGEVTKDQEPPTFEPTPSDAAHSRQGVSDDDVLGARSVRNRVQRREQVKPFDVEGATTADETQPVPTTVSDDEDDGGPQILVEAAGDQGNEGPPQEMSPTIGDLSSPEAIRLKKLEDDAAAQSLAAGHRGRLGIGPTRVVRSSLDQERMILQGKEDLGSIERATQQELDRAQAERHDVLKDISTAAFSVALGANIGDMDKAFDSGGEVVGEAPLGAASDSVMDAENPLEVWLGMGAAGDDGLAETEASGLDEGLGARKTVAPEPRSEPTLGDPLDPNARWEGDLRSGPPPGPLATRPVKDRDDDRDWDRDLELER